MIERVLQHPRSSLLVVLVAVPLACWVWVAVMARDMYGPMTGASAWMMRLEWDPPRLILLWAMWAAMMFAMMLPTAAPIVLLYARALRNRSRQTRPAVSIYALASGYALVWAFFSIGATWLQRLLARAFVLTPMMEPAVPTTAGWLLILAGLYQWTPFKAACLRVCRSPIAMLSAGWRDGPAGAFRMGLSHGLYCLGCCWALMLLLFAGGVMNLAVILALTVWVAIEKLAPFGEQTARIAGVLLTGAGVWMLTR